MRLGNRACLGTAAQGISLMASRPDWKFNADLAKASEVEIRFIAEGSATLVELGHRGLERHGEGYEQLRATLDSPDAWAGTLAAFANVIANPKPAIE